MTRYKEYKQKLGEFSIQKPEISKIFESCDPEIVFLGTQSMRPNLYKNVSSIYLRFSREKNTGMLLDCGEGSYSQLLHCYGVEETKKILVNLELIWISHLHKDHCWGVFQMLSEINRACSELKAKREPPFLIIPTVMIPHLENYSKDIEKLYYRPVFNYHINKKIELHQNFVESQNEILKKRRTGIISFFNDPSLQKYFDEFENISISNAKLLEENLKSEFELTSFVSLDVDHCPEAYAISFRHQNGWNFIYSGDKRPCDVMAKEIGETTILVHESTFCKSQHEEVLEKFDKHTTEQEAIQTGMDLKAWRTILTHFSQRYMFGSIEKGEGQCNEEFSKYRDQNTLWAFDFMKMKFSELEFLPSLSKAMRILLPEDYI